MEVLLIMFTTLLICTCGQSIVPDNTTSAIQTTQTSTELEIGVKIRNAFKFFLLPTTTTAPETTMTTKPISLNRNSFIIFRTSSTTPQPSMTSENVARNTQQTTTTEDSSEFTSFGYFTEWTTEESSNAPDETTPQPTTKIVTTATRPRITSSKILVPRFRLISSTRRPSTTSKTSPKTPKHYPSTTSRKITKTTTTTVPDGSVIHELKNSGFKFIRLPTTSTDSNPTSTRRKPPTKSTTDNNVPPQDVETEHVDYTTASDMAGVGIAGNAGLNGDGVKITPELGLPTLSPAGIWIHGFPYYHYLKDPAAFWAANWYWILIVLLLIIFFFIIPGFCLQIYIARWCRRRRRKNLFKTNTDDIDLEIGRLGKDKSKIEDENNYQTCSSDSFSTDPHSDTDNENIEMSSPISSSARGPVSNTSGTETNQQQKSTTEEVISSVNSATTVIVIPQPEEPVRISHIPLTPPEKPKDSFEFPDRKSNTDGPDDAQFQMSPAASRSDIGLDIGNETIIKSNAIEKSMPRDSTRPPFRPPKPDHLIMRDTGVITEQRPHRPKPIAQKERKPEKDELKRRKVEEPMIRNRPEKRKRKETEKVPAKNDKKVNKRNRDDSEHRHRKPPKKKPDSRSTQSLMQAARSLEDILEAITKLTREYPVPKIPTNAEVRSSDPSRKFEKPKDRRDKQRGEKPKKKSSRRNRRPEDVKKKDRVDDRLEKNKLKRTKNWANEQQKIEKRKDKRSRKKEREKRPTKKEEKDDEKSKKKVEKKEKKEEESGKENEKKIPTLVKETIEPIDRTRQERRRKRLERDLEKLRRYHNSVPKKEDKETGDDSEAMP